MKNVEIADAKIAPRCDICDRDFKRPQDLKFHNTMLHSGVSRPPRKNQSNRILKPVDPASNGAPPPIAVKARRAPAKAKTVASDMDVHFCPGCGCNIAMVKMALSMARKIS